jgi:hypothetical protein
VPFEPETQESISEEETMNYQSKPARLVFLVVLALATIVSVVKLSRADHEQDVVKVGDLAGSWQAALLWSNSGCGPASGLVNFTLDATGSTNSATFVGHAGAGPGCGDQTTTQTFTIHTLNPNGSGTAGLTCGVACGWEFQIQVDRQRTIFNLVDVDPANPNNFVAGTAIRQSHASHESGE